MMFDNYISSYQLMKTQVFPCLPFPLAATPSAEGINFALFSRNATKVEICLFTDEENGSQEERIELIAHTHDVWTISFPVLNLNNITVIRFMDRMTRLMVTALTPTNC